MHLPFDNLAQLLEARGRDTPDRIAFTFGGEAHTYHDVWTGAMRFARLLRERGVEHGDRVVLAAPNGAEFFDIFYGVLSLGAVAVPVYPDPRTDRLARVARLCGAKLAVGATLLGPEALAAFQEQADSIDLPLLHGDAARDHQPLSELPAIGREDLAFLQYTSGSTGDPKGVMLDHGALLSNIGSMQKRGTVTEDDVFVSWLPVYHDLGLIMMTMLPFGTGAVLHLLPTSVTNVRDWLETIDRCGGTFTGAPDFGYRLCLRYVKDPSQFDLSSLRIAINAAEPVRAQTVRAFESAFGIQDVVTPAYGLAEGTVGVAACHPGDPIRVDPRGLVSVGQPFPGVSLKIVGEGTDGPELEPGEIGEIAVQSTARCQGYFGNEQATSDLFRSDEHFLTGDMGYLDDLGRLYIVGRQKNIIITAGRTIANQEVEELVDGHRETRGVAAVGIDRGQVEGEQIYVFCEVKRGGGMSEEELARISADVVNLVHQGLGLRPARVYLIRVGTIPRTYNGKIKHAELRDRYLAGTLREQEKILFPDY